MLARTFGTIIFMLAVSFLIGVLLSQHLQKGDGSLLMLLPWVVFLLFAGIVWAISKANHLTNSGILGVGLVLLILSLAGGTYVGFVWNIL